MHISTPTVFCINEIHTLMSVSYTCDREHNLINKKNLLHEKTSQLFVDIH